MDVEAWLKTLGLEQYAQAFRDNDIDGELLTKLTGDDLKDIGVSSVGHRRKLLEAISALNQAANVPVGSDEVATGRSAPVTSPSPHSVSSLPPAVQPERRQLTVLFCDLVGSTELANRLDPEEYRELLGVYARTATNAITRFEGFVAKYMGDGVLAYFGYPKAHEDEAGRAVRTGLALVEEISRLRPSPGAGSS